MKRLISYFFQGLLYSAPIAATLYVLYKMFALIDGIIGNLLPLYIPGIGLVALIALITLFGYLGTLYLFHPLFASFESMLEKAPLVKIIYSSVKDMVSAFVGKKKRFTRPVLVTVNKETGLQQIGFLTQEDLSDLGLGKDKVVVYFPFPYSFMGNLLVVPAADVTPLSASGTEVMKFVVSGGVTEIGNHDAK